MWTIFRGYNQGCLHKQVVRCEARPSMESARKSTKGSLRGGEFIDINVFLCLRQVQTCGLFCDRVTAFCSHFTVSLTLLVVARNAMKAEESDWGGEGEERQRHVNPILPLSALFPVLHDASVSSHRVLRCCPSPRLPHFSQPHFTKQNKNKITNRIN